VSHKTIAIIGAGIAGALLARKLADAGIQVEVFEKSRGTGGRLASTRLGDHSVDLGAPYLEAHSPEFKQWLEQEVSQQHLSHWQPKRADFQLQALPDRQYYVGNNRLSMLTRQWLSRGPIQLHTQVRIGKIARYDSGVYLYDDEDQALGIFDLVVIATPAPQAVPLLTEMPAWQQLAQQITPDICWLHTLQLSDALELNSSARENGSQESSSLEADIIEGNHPILQRAIRNSSKPGCVGPESWVLHARSDWSEQHVDADKEWIAEQLQQNLQQVLDVANARDETGGYVFSGYQIDKRPFLLQPDNSVVYQGDDGVRELKISKSVEVPLNQPGDEAFLEVANPIGDFVGVYNNNQSGISVNRAVIQDRGAYVDGANYTFNFTDTNGDGALELAVTDNAAVNLITIDPYVPGQTVAFNGMEVNIDGTPLPGDQLELAPQETVSVFQAIKDAIDWVSRTGTITGTEQHAVDYGHILSNINASLNHISTRQGEAGINLQLIQSQETFHADNELLMEQGRSVIEDLDFATAVTKFEQSKQALQAAQQTYAQLQGLSLFNYI